MKFVDELPPQLQSGSPPRYLKEAAKLRANPGKWALLTVTNGAASAYSLGNAIRTGTYVAFRPQGAFEASCRGADVYARYVGEAS